jgi:MtfA peptidase
MEDFFWLIIVGVIIILLVIKYRSFFSFEIPSKKFKPEWRQILLEKVNFYRRLDDARKTVFEYRIEKFIKTYQITGVDTEVNDTDRVLIAASGVIPLFGFEDWHYPHFKGVKLYADEFEGKLGEVKKSFVYDVFFYTEYTETKILFSRKALYAGFEDPDDGLNTGIHEFIHVIDLFDNKTDGIPGLLLENKYIIPWMFLIHREIKRIHSGESDIREYATKSPSEFFAVIAEYFFERPEDFSREHPELHRAMEKIFMQAP